MLAKEMLNAHNQKVREAQSESARNKDDFFEALKGNLKQTFWRKRAHKKLVKSFKDQRLSTTESGLFYIGDTYHDTSIENLLRKAYFVYYLRNSGFINVTFKALKYSDEIVEINNKDDIETIEYLSKIYIEAYIPTNKSQEILFKQGE